MVQCTTRWLPSRSRDGWLTKRVMPRAWPCASTNMDTLRQVFRSLESSSLGHGVSADVARSVLICAGFDESACDEILDEDEALNLMRFEEVISALEERSKAAEK